MATENMSTENENTPEAVNPPAPQQNAAPPQSAPFEPTAAERIASGAYEHGAEAADALRRGELAQYSTVDPLADSDDRLIALLSYVTQIVIPVIMPVIVLVSESSNKRPFQRYHAVQSLAFACVFWSLAVLVGVGTVIIQIIPLVGMLVGLMAFCMAPIGWFASVLLLLYYGLQAYKGRRFAIPGLTSFLRDQNWL